MSAPETSLADLPLFQSASGGSPDFRAQRSSRTATPPAAGPRALVNVIDEIATKRNVEWFVGLLAGRDWTTAKVICGEIGWVATENNKRKLRKLADASGGRVAGHQKGYKLVREMTKEEFTWWENEQLKMSDALRSRVIESRRVFYAGAATA